MKAIIFVVLLGVSLADVTIYFDKSCTCANYKSSTDCGNGYGCKWDNNACRAQTCTDFTAQTDCENNGSTGCKWDTTCKTITACSDMTTQNTCTKYAYSTFKCAWNGTACATFTACADYTPTSGSCQSVTGQTCQVSTTDTTKCTNYVASTCASQTTEASCYSGCIWKNNACSTATACSDADGLESYCRTGHYCIWSATDSKCKIKVCSDFTSSTDCTYVKGFNSEGTLCIWDSTTSKCGNASNVSHLTSANCRTTSQYTYTWDGTNCVQCQSYGTMMMGIILVLLMILI